MNSAGNLMSLADMTSQRRIAAVYNACLSVVLLSLCADIHAGEAGWKTAEIIKGLEQRDHLVHAMRQKKEEVYLLEHRWVSKPIGAFQEKISNPSGFAPFSQAKRDARAKLGSSDLDFIPQYEGKEWWLVMRTIIAIDRRDPKAESLIAPESMKALVTNLQNSMDNLPKLFDEKHTKARLVMDFKTEPGEIYQSTGIGLQRDEVFGSLYNGFEVALLPAVTSWYASQGAPYVQAPHVVQSVWFWHEFVEEKNIAAYIEESRKKFDQDNQGLPHPIKVFDLRTPEK